MRLAHDEDGRRVLIDSTPSPDGAVSVYHDWNGAAHIRYTTDRRFDESLHRIHAATCTRQLITH